ncbi:MAG: hypothetical protein ABIK43_00735 [candidate division WOR-3 bacterium]
MKAKLAVMGVLLGTALMAWPQPGEPAPSVTLPDTAWVTHTIPGDYRGNVMLLNFWQSG